jgi:hypothetical protein
VSGRGQKVAAQKLCNDASRPTAPMHHGPRSHTDNVGLSSSYNSHSWAMRLTAARCGRSPIFIARPLMCCGLARLRFARHVCGQHASARIYLHAAISREQDVRFAMALRKPDHVCVQITSISYSSSSYKSAGDLRSAQRTR